jgi:hypothetical protein
MSSQVLDEYIGYHEQGIPKVNTGSLTEEQMRDYDREGFIVVPGLVSQEDMAPIREAIHQKVSQIADDLLANGMISDKLENEPFPTRLAKLFAGKTDADFLKYGRGWRDLLPGYFEFMSNPRILDAVESLIGPEIFCNPVYNTRPKVPGVAAGAVPWHQDRSYWPDANWNPVITVWIPLVDTNEVNGCLHVWPRTHKTKMIGFHNETYSGTGYLELDNKVKDEADRHAIALPIKAGDAILFNDRCIHMSTPNRSDHVRWSVDLRYQPTGQERMDQHGVGFLARSKVHPERVAQLEDWLAKRPEHEA